MEEKDKTIQKLTKINLKLKNSLELISKKMDEKIQNANLFKNKNNNNNKTLRPTSNLSHENLNKNDLKSNDNNKKIFPDNIIKEKELNNAINMIKILRKDNQRLQNKIDEMEQNREIEKKAQDKKIIVIQRELQEHKICKQKMENFQERIKKLTENNKNLMDKLIYGRSRKGNIKNNMSIESDGENGGRFYRIKKKIIKEYNGLNSNKNIKKDNYFNFKKLGEIRTQNNSLPKIDLANNQLLNSIKNSNNSINININNIFNNDEMFQLNRVFKNAKIYQIIIKKFEILQKSKDSIDNKYKLEKKQFTKRIYSMQQQIDYLTGKIRERELKINILQAQLNESKLEKKHLLKRVKILSEGFEVNEFNTNHLEENVNNKNETQNNKKKIKKIKFNDNKYQDETSIDNSDNKGQKINNSIESGNGGESSSERNFSEETN